MERESWLYALALSAVASAVAGLLVPLYIVRLGGGAAQLGVSAALASLVGAPGAVLAGRYADRTGKRRGIVVAALAVSALALAALPVLRSVPAVIAVNAVLSVALASISPVLTMLVVGDAPESDWAGRIARLNTFQGYGATVGLVLGTVWTLSVGALIAVGPTQATLFGLAALFGVASAVLAARSLPADARLDVGRRPSGRIATALARNNRTVRDATFWFGTNRLFWASRSLTWARLRRFRSDLPTALWVYFVAATLFFTGFATFWAPLPLYLADVAKLDSGAIFALYLVNNVGSAGLYGLAGRFSTSHDVRIVQGGALSVRAASFVGVGVLGAFGGAVVGGGPASLLAVGVLVAVVGVTWAFIAVAGTAIVSRLAPKRVRGGVLGAYAAISAVAGSVGALLGGWIASRSFEAAFFVAGGLVVAGGVLVFSARRLSAGTGVANESATTD